MLASRIAILGLNFPPEATGNAPYTGALSAALANRGHRVTAVVGHPHYPEWMIREGYGQWTLVQQIGGVEVRRVRHYVPRMPRGVKRLLSELSFGVRLVMTRWRRPDVVLVVSPALFASALAALRTRMTPRGPRLVTWVQDIYTLGLVETGEGNSLVVAFTRWVERRVLRTSDRVIVIHQRFADFLIEDLGVDASRVTVIRNWTHLKPSKPQDRALARSRLGWPPETVLAVHTGNMGTKQGLENVIDAARLADSRAMNVCFVLVGDGGERSALEQYARGIERIRFVEPLEEDEYTSALAAADILLVNEKPGVAAMAVPSKLTSYLDSGRPIIAATNINGVTASEVRAANAGTVIASGDPAALLDAVWEMHIGRDRAENFGASGREYRLRVLDQDTALAHWVAVIEELSAR